MLLLLTDRFLILPCFLILIMPKLLIMPDTVYAKNFLHLRGKSPVVMIW